MAKQLGRELILALGSTVIAGGQNITVTDNAASIDATTPGSTAANPPQHDAFVGKRMVSFSGTFTMVDDSGETALDTVMKSATRKTSAKITIPSFKSYTGSCLFTEMRWEGSIDGMVQYSIAGEFVGAITEAAA